MIRLVLSPEEHALLEQTRRTRPQLAERCHYILLNAQGWVAYLWAADNGEAPSRATCVV